MPLRRRGIRIRQQYSTVDRDTAAQHDASNRLTWLKGRAASTSSQLPGYLTTITKPLHLVQRTSAPTLLLLPPKHGSDKAGPNSARRVADKLTMTLHLFGHPSTDAARPVSRLAGTAVFLPVCKGCWLLAAGCWLLACSSRHRHSRGDLPRYSTRAVRVRVDHHHHHQHHHNNTTTPPSPADAPRVSVHTNQRPGMSCSLPRSLPRPSATEIVTLPRPLSEYVGWAALVS